MHAATQACGLRYRIRHESKAAIGRCRESRVPDACTTMASARCRLPSLYPTTAFRLILAAADSPRTPSDTCANTSLRAYIATSTEHPGRLPGTAHPFQVVNTSMRPETRANASVQADPHRICRTLLIGDILNDETS